jgi:hypothetical protein
MKKIYILVVLTSLFIGCEQNKPAEKSEIKEVSKSIVISTLTKQQILDSLNKVNDNRLIYRILIENNDTICKYASEFENLSVREHAMSDVDFKKIMRYPNDKPVGSVQVSELVKMSANHSCYEKYYKFEIVDGKITTKMTNFTISDVTFYSIPLINYIYKQNPKTTLDFYISNQNRLIFKSVANGKILGFFDYSDRPKSNY